ncbi:MAG: biopolymer transporter ExbD [Deferribacteraceae bacterium]|jgi:biopolymer transport protein ExbD|nr:biopolymer transporter ExbD [Deferribacteraceae bacterium]
MNFRRANSTPVGINMTPLLDAIFILLLFFAVNTTLITASEIQVDLPEATTSETTSEVPEIKIVITKDGNIFVNDRGVSIDTLDRELAALYVSSPSATIVLEADTAALHGAVVTVIDSGRGAGFESFAISVDEK